VRVILRQLLALPCELGFVCLRDFLSAKELSKAVEGRCTAEWVQSTYATSASKHTHTISPFSVLGNNQLCDNTCIGITTNRKIEEGVAWERG